MDDLIGRLLAEKPKVQEKEEPEASELSLTQTDSQDSGGGWLTNKSLTGKKKTKMLKCYDTQIPKGLTPSKLVWARNDRFSKKAAHGTLARNWFPARLCDDQEGMFMKLADGDWPIPEDKVLVEWIDINKEEPSNHQKEVRWAWDIIPYDADVTEVRSHSIHNSPKDRGNNKDKDEEQKSQKKSTPASSSKMAQGILADMYNNSTSSNSASKPQQIRLDFVKKSDSNANRNNANNANNANNSNSNSNSNEVQPQAQVVKKNSWNLESELNLNSYLHARYSADQARHLFEGIMNKAKNMLKYVNM